MKFQYAQLEAGKTAIERLELQSFEMNVYLVKLTLQGESAMLFDGERPMRFHSTQHVRDCFEGFNVTQAVMTHASPYDEMIGNPPGSDTPMEVPFSLTQPY